MHNVYYEFLIKFCFIFFFIFFCLFAINIKFAQAQAKLPGLTRLLFVVFFFCFFIYSYLLFFLKVIIFFFHGFIDLFLRSNFNCFVYIAAFLFYFSPSFFVVSLSLCADFVFHELTFLQKKNYS
jgi:hypothetical protein